ncbi:uncharacterized protein LOC130672705 isoform X2 [Microplitis mediator]|uniref:uncharacterized protein LOC130672705 isoform X2 n=1 Tax=Microplitis mediator TaxID=375433 RepID=UPI002555F3AD|nr:uncharacterized protein LOC130672705 isoform X2 [Microplitis mediator]
MKNFLTKDTTIRIGDTVDKSMGKVIECNVNMNVSVSNNKKTIVYRRIQNLMTLLIIVTFFIVYFQLKRDARALEAQINSMNKNFAILMLKYERLNRNLNQINTRQYTTSKIRQKYININSDNNKNIHNNNNNNDDDDEENKLKTRFVRSIARFNEYNGTDNVPMITNQNDTGSWIDSRAGRSRRDDGRGKQRRKLKRRLKRSRRRLGPLVATFVGAVPEQHVTDTVYIGPWVKQNESRYGFNKFHLVEDKRSIEVTVNGLFMVSAQIYYYGEPSHYSYWILLSSEGTSLTRKIIKCATVSAVTATEASCYTSVILPLRRGDRLHIQQQERDRLINLREGHSYIQLMLLSSDQQKRRIST